MDSRTNYYAYALSFVMLFFIIGGLGYGLYSQSGNIWNRLPGLQFLLNGESAVVLEGSDNPLQINYTLQEDEDGKFRLTCVGDLLGFRDAIKEANGQYVTMYQNAILVIYGEDQVALDLIVDEMISIVDAVDALPVPSCVSFMSTLGGSHRAFVEALLFLVDAINTTDPQTQGQAFINYTANNNAAFLANGFFFGKLELTIELVEGVEDV